MLILRKLPLASLLLTALVFAGCTREANEGAQPTVTPTATDTAGTTAPI